MKVQRFSVLFVILGLLTIITGRAQAQMITMRQAFISDDVIASQQFLSHSAGQPAWPANAGHLLAISDDGDNAAIGYATGGDRTLIRWFWSNESDSPIFRVYRQTDGGPETMVAEVTPVTTPATAINFLNTTDPRWPNLYADLLDQFGPEGVVDIPSFHDFMDNNKFAAQQLANERYPVALVIGRGYLDLDVVPGSTYTYRVEAVRAETVTLGSVTLVAGQLTPLDKPTGLSAVFLGAGSDHVRSQEGDWATAQQNRRFDQTVYLAWDAGKTGDDFPAAWVTGYDIYRAPTGSPDAFVQVNGDLAVQPMPATVPVSETDPSDDALAYELISYYYADNPPEYGDWSYRVAPRDLLGQVRQWPDNAAQFSAAITATAYDFLPPPAPSDLVVEVPASNDQVVLTWSMTPTDDLAGFRIERTLTLNAESEPGGCFTDTDCWKEAATVAGDALTWTDTDATLETVRWYRVQAVDHFGNRSLFAGPVQAVIHDIDPPPPPQIRVGHCDPTGSDKDGDCITGGGSADTTRIRIYCKFSTDGSELPVAEVAGNSLDAFDLTTVYTPPLTLEDVVCRARAADAHGNLSGFSNAVTLELFPLTPPEAPQPIITDVETIAGGSAGWTGQVKWEMVDIPGLVGFRIAREDQSADPPSVVTFTVGPDARDYSDATVEPSKTYIYTVTAIFEPGFYNVAETTSLPRTFRVVAEGQRPLTEIGWVHINFTAGTGTQLEWECSECELQRTPWWAVFRSVHRDADYIQLTPVLNAGPAYTDTSAQHNRYWYVIVEFDPRTGEPIRYTRPNSVAHGLAPLSSSEGASLSAAEVATTVKLDGWEASLFSIDSTENRELAASGIGACKPVPVDRRQPLRFGDGFEVFPRVFWSLNPKSLSGTGYLRVTPPRRVIDIPVTFSGITVGDRRNHVCSGSLSVDVVTDLGSPIRVQFPGGLRYAVYQIVAQPWFDTPNDGAGDVRLHLPDTLRRVYSPPVEGDDIALPASLTKLHSDLSFDFSYDFASNPAHTCTTPIVAFNLETLPTTVVPLGLFTADETGITIESSCMRYLERYSGALGPRPTPPSATAADSNDGFLRGTFTGGLTTITGSGLGGNFATHDDMSWIASYPWGFNLTVHAVEVLLDKSQIVAGGFGNGSVTMAYQQTISESTTGVVSAGFDNMTVDPRGAAVTALATSDPVSWLIPGGFTMKAGDWELYLGTVTTAGRPQTAMWRTRPDDAKEVGLPLPAELDPGFNRRLSSTPLLWANCSGPAATFDAAADTYLRHGGVSQRQKAKLTAMVDLSIHGYEAGIDTLDLAFLDNYIWDRNVTGEIRLPFPPAISLRLIDMWFNDDGCIGGGSVPAGEGDKTLKFWQIVAHIKAVEFRDNPEFSTADEAWDAMLWAIGALDLPHVAPPGSSSIATIDIEAAFRPDGSFYSSQLIHDRPDYSFDGFPLLLEQVDLSAVGATPDWQSDATIATPPSNDWSARGYVDL
ncbi:MAG: fibronectin type III domain-containing protein, partial [Anaerolineae bacterium]